jgi:hypothetical protein
LPIIKIAAKPTSKAKATPALFNALSLLFLYSLFLEISGEEWIIYLLTYKIRA